MNYTQEQVIGFIDKVDVYAKQATRIVENLAIEQTQKTGQKVPGDVKKQMALKILDVLLTIAAIKYNLTPEIKNIIEAAISSLIDFAVMIYNQAKVFIKSVGQPAPITAGAK